MGTGYPLAPAALKRSPPAQVEIFREALPSFFVEVDECLCEGNKVTIQLTFKSHGNHGETPSSQDKDVPMAVWTATTIMEIKGGKVARTWVNSDALSALIQMGLMEDIVQGPFARNAKRVTTPTHTRKEKDIVRAVLGRVDEHPDEVLTGDEWIDYFQRVNKKNSRSSSMDFMTDKVSGLDIAA